MAGPRRSPFDRLRRVTAQLYNRFHSVIAHAQGNVRNATDHGMYQVLLLFAVAMPVIVEFHQFAAEHMLTVFQEFTQMMDELVDFWVATVVTMVQSHMAMIQNSISLTGFGLDILVVAAFVGVYIVGTHYFPHEEGTINTVIGALIALWQIARSQGHL